MAQDSQEIFVLRYLETAYVHSGIEIIVEGSFGTYPVLKLILERRGPLRRLLLTL